MATRILKVVSQESREMVLLVRPEIPPPREKPDVVIQVYNPMRWKQEDPHCAAFQTNQIGEPQAQERNPVSKK